MGLTLHLHTSNSSPLSSLPPSQSSDTLQWLAVLLDDSKGCSSDEARTHPNLVSLSKAKNLRGCNTIHQRHLHFVFLSWFIIIESFEGVTPINRWRLSRSHNAHLDPQPALALNIASWWVVEGDDMEQNKKLYTIFSLQQYNKGKGSV